MGMPAEFWTTLATGIFGGGGIGFLVLDRLLVRKSKEADAEPITSKEVKTATAEKALDASDVPKVSRAEFDAVVLSFRRTMAEQAEEVAELRGRVERAEQKQNDAIRYSGTLREQVTGLGAVPPPWPPSLLP